MTADKTVKERVCEPLSKPRDEEIVEKDLNEYIAEQRDAQCIGSGDDGWYVEQFDDYVSKSVEPQKKFWLFWGKRIFELARAESRKEFTGTLVLVLEKELPCERTSFNETYKARLVLCDKHVPYPDAQQGVPCPNCRRRKAIMEGVERDAAGAVPSKEGIGG